MGNVCSKALLQDLGASFYLVSWKEVTILCDIPSMKTQNFFKSVFAF